uniref:Retrovirus-related Pol polyprotein from transposon TNT 1-94 n=1 Tax=Cajanus cajan TaxID=3821 RepID=A0A151TET5_CAJCA|nr:hypothetical protein KK1_011826 [Cajanus cajan]
MLEFLLWMKALVYLLTSIGDSVSLQEHIDVILEGLPKDYSSVILVIKSKLDPLSIKEVETLLLTHKMCLKKFLKKLFSDFATINLIETSPRSTIAQNQLNSTSVQVHITQNFEVENQG